MNHVSCYGGSFRVVGYHVGTDHLVVGWMANVIRPAFTAALKRRQSFFNIRYTSIEVPIRLLYPFVFLFVERACVAYDSKEIDLRRSTLSDHASRPFFRFPLIGRSIMDNRGFGARSKTWRNVEQVGQLQAPTNCCAGSSFL